MNDRNRKPEPKPEGAMPSPRPPKRTAVGLGPDDEDRPRRVQPKKETMRINLPPLPAGGTTNSPKS